MVTASFYQKKMLKEYAPSYFFITFAVGKKNYQLLKYRL